MRGARIRMAIGIILIALVVWGQDMLGFATSDSRLDPSLRGATDPVNGGFNSFSNRNRAFDIGSWAADLRAHQTQIQLNASQRSVDFVGDAAGHLAQRREFRGLNQHRLRFA